MCEFVQQALIAAAEKAELEKNDVQKQVKDREAQIAKLLEET